MDIKTLEPMDYDTADVPVNFQSANVVSVGFSNPTFHNIGYSMSEPASIEPGTIDFTSLQFGSVGADTMRFDVTNYGLTESGDINFSGNAGATTQSSLSGQYEMDFFFPRQ